MSCSRGIDGPRTPVAPTTSPDFHAAQGLLFEMTDRVSKTHKGVQSEFSRLSAGDSSFDAELRAFLGRAYNLKAIADYETGAGAAVSDTEAAAAIAAATRFVAAIETSLQRRPGGTS